MISVSTAQTPSRWDTFIKDATCFRENIKSTLSTWANSLKNWLQPSRNANSTTMSARSVTDQTTTTSSGRTTPQSWVITSKGPSNSSYRSSRSSLTLDATPASAALAIQSRLKKVSEKPSSTEAQDRIVLVADRCCDQMIKLLKDLRTKWQTRAPLSDKQRIRTMELIEDFTTFYLENKTVIDRSKSDLHRGTPSPRNIRAEDTSYTKLLEKLSAVLDKIPSE